jgi:hypothetical protein
MIAQDLDDIIIAQDQPSSPAFVPVDRVSVSQTAEIGVRIIQNVRCQQIILG